MKNPNSTSYNVPAKLTFDKDIKDESLIEAAKWIAGADEFYLQQFKDSGDVIAIGGLSAYDEKEMHALADAVSPFVPRVQVRGI